MRPLTEKLTLYSHCWRNAFRLRPLVIPMDHLQSLKGLGAVRRNSRSQSFTGGTSHLWPGVNCPMFPPISEELTVNIYQHPQGAICMGPGPQAEKTEKEK